jgi:hypothetical protein
MLRGSKKKVDKKINVSILEELFCNLNAHPVMMPSAITNNGGHLIFEN